MVTVQAMVEKIPAVPGEDTETTTLSADAATYTDAKAQLDDDVPDGWRILWYRTER